MKRTNSNKHNLFISHLTTFDRLIETAETGAAMHRTDVVTQASAALYKLGFDEASHLYHVLSLNRVQVHRSQTETALIELADHASPFIRARALTALGTNEFEKGGSRQAQVYYDEATQLCDGPLIHLYTATMTAQIASANGNHKQALNLLTNALGLTTRGVHRLNHLNSMAVELNALGRADEARYYLSPCLASPYRIYYPEWSETAKEIHPTRSRIYVSAPNLDNMTARVAATPLRALMDEFTRYKKNKQADSPALPSHSQLILANYVRDDVVLSEDECAFIRTLATLVAQNHPSFERMKEIAEYAEQAIKEEKQS